MFPAPGTYWVDARGCKSLKAPPFKLGKVLETGGTHRALRPPHTVRRALSSEVEAGVRAPATTPDSRPSPRRTRRAHWLTPSRRAGRRGTDGVDDA